jgi:hypothetical protein
MRVISHALHRFCCPVGLYPLSHRERAEVSGLSWRGYTPTLTLSLWEREPSAGLLKICVVDQ